MSFREKSAWITLISVIACFGVYYGAVFGGLGPDPVKVIERSLGR